MSSAASDPPVMPGLSPCPGRNPSRTRFASHPAHLLASALFPADNAKNVCPDTPLRITFASAPTVGSGQIQIFDAADDAIVETIDVSVSVRSKSIGGQPNYNYYPVIIADHVASLYLTHPLAYDKTYYVKISAGALNDSAGNPFAGFNGSGGWRFSTKPAPPLVGGRRITVSADGSGDFATVQGAIDFVPQGNTSPITIFIRRGTYQEIIFFTDKHNLTILGEDRKQTVIEYPNNDRFNNNSGGNPFAPGAAAPGAVPVRGGAVYRRGLFLAHRVNGLTIANLTLHNTTPQGGSQAEAIILNGTPTAHAIITNVDLKSFQDTLQINGQAYVSNSYIEGDIDFMWGTGPVFFENLHARSLRSNAYYTQIRNPPTNHGFVYKNCVFDGASGVTGNFLSRIAPPRFPASEVVLIGCRLTDAVGAVGWRLDPAPGVAANSTIEAPGVHFWEFDSQDAAGKPLDMSKRLTNSRRLKAPDDDEAIRNYSDPGFVLGGWTPALAPIITSQPAAVSVGVGQKALLTVAVAAVPAPAYQWQRNGRNIAGATLADYTIERASRRERGSYCVVISNSVGSIVSAAARITIRD